MPEDRNPQAWVCQAVKLELETEGWNNCNTWSEGIQRHLITSRKKRLWPVLRYYPGISLKELRKGT
jgi:hypothetical protein